MSADAASGTDAARQRWQRLSAWLDEALDREDPAERAAWRAALQAPPDELAALDALIAGDRKSTRLNSSHSQQSRMPSSA